MRQLKAKINPLLGVQKGKIDSAPMERKTCIKKIFIFSFHGGKFHNGVSEDQNLTLFKERGLGKQGKTLVRGSPRNTGNI